MGVKMPSSAGSTSWMRQPLFGSNRIPHQYNSLQNAKQNLFNFESSDGILVGDTAVPSLSSSKLHSQPRTCFHASGDVCASSHLSNEARSQGIKTGHSHVASWPQGTEGTTVLGAQMSVCIPCLFQRKPCTDGCKPTKSRHLPSWCVLVKSRHRAMCTLGNNP